MNLFLKAVQNIGIWTNYIKAKIKKNTTEEQV